MHAFALLGKALAQTRPQVRSDGPLSPRNQNVEPGGPADADKRRS